MDTSKAPKQSKHFIFVFLATIIVLRAFLYFIPRTSTIYTDKFHHIYLGLILLLIYFLIHTHTHSKYLLALTLGLIADQITVLPLYILNLLNLQTHPFMDYWSPYSLISTTIIIIISLILIKKYQGD